MKNLAELLHPIPVEKFKATYFGRQPLYIPAIAGHAKSQILDWAELNAMLSRTAAFTPTNLRLLHNGEPVPVETYCIKSVLSGAVVPSPAKIDILLSTGASLIANEVQSLTSSLSCVANMLGTALSARVGANVYCSFTQVQAFGTHFDLHDVFAIQTEGEKTWTLYEGRADAPIAFPNAPDSEVRRWFLETRGAVKQEVRMRPGDVLYLPRGWYHDALAESKASLHVTFSVSPLTGKDIFALLEHAAMQSAEFRAYLPTSSDDEGRALKTHLERLGQHLAALTGLSEFLDEVTMAQQRLVPPLPAYNLPHRKPLTVYRATGITCPIATGPVRVAMEWALSQPQFALEDLVAEFDFIAASAIVEAVMQAVRSGALEHVSPSGGPA